MTLDGWYWEKRNSPNLKIVISRPFFSGIFLISAFSYDSHYPQRALSKHEIRFHIKPESCELSTVTTVFQQLCIVLQFHNLSSSGLWFANYGTHLHNLVIAEVRWQTWARCHGLMACSDSAPTKFDWQPRCICPRISECTKIALSNFTPSRVGAPTEVEVFSSYDVAVVKNSSDLHLHLYKYD